MKKLILTSFFISIICTSLFCQKNELNSYLLNSARELNLSEEIDFDMDSLELKNRRLFAMGEVHGVATYEKIKLELFKYLYFKANVRVIIVELGNSHAFLFNNFLKSGDTTLITGFNYSETQFWKELQKFNFKNHGQIEVIGIDFERSSAIVKSLELLFREDVSEKISVEIETFVNALRASKNKDSKEEAFIRMQDFYISNMSTFEKYLGKNLEIFKSILFNEVPFSGKTSRDKFMVDNLASHQKKNPDKKYFGYFGISHTNRNYNNLIGRLNEDKDSYFYQNITVFMPQYINCKTSYGGKILAVDNYGILIQEKIKNSSQLTESLDYDIALINLKNVPKGNERLSSASDYLIILKNQF